MQLEGDAGLAVLVVVLLRAGQVGAGDDRVQHDDLRRAAHAVVRQRDAVVARHADRGTRPASACSSTMLKVSTPAWVSMSTSSSTSVGVRPGTSTRTRFSPCLMMFGSTRPDLVGAALNGLARGVDGIDLQLVEVRFGELDLDRAIGALADRVDVRIRPASSGGPSRAGIRRIRNAHDDRIALRRSLADRDQRRFAQLLADHAG